MLYLAILLLVLIPIGYLLSLIGTSLNAAKSYVAKINESMAQALDYKEPYNVYNIYDMLIYGLSFVLTILIMLIIGNAIRKKSGGE